MMSVFNYWQTENGPIFIKKLRNMKLNKCRFKATVITDVTTLFSYNGIRNK